MKSPIVALELLREAQGMCHLATGVRNRLFSNAFAVDMASTLCSSV